MHRAYGKDGLVCISVSLDEEQNRQAALDFLKKQGATFSNYLLDQEVSFWQDKFDLNAPPAVFVFDRDNRWAGKFDTSNPDKPFSYEGVENLVKKLLRPAP